MFHPILPSSQLSLIPTSLLSSQTNVTLVKSNFPSSFIFPPSSLTNVTLAKWFPQLSQNLPGTLPVVTKSHPHCLTFISTFLHPILPSSQHFHHHHWPMLHWRNPFPPTSITTFLKPYLNHKITSSLLDHNVKSASRSWFECVITFPTCTVAKGKWQLLVLLLRGSDSC